MANGERVRSGFRRHALNPHCIHLGFGEKPGREELVLQSKHFPTAAVGGNTPLWYATIPADEAHAVKKRGGRHTWNTAALVFGANPLSLGTPAVAQRPVPVSSWVTELGAGAGADLFARGPWINPSWRRSFVGRVGIATGLSLLYEYAVEPWNAQTNAARWPDAAQRLVGTLALEALWAGVRLVQP